MYVCDGLEVWWYLFFICGECE